MKLKHLHGPGVLVLALACTLRLHGQGVFQNLDFEQARLHVTPTVPGVWGNSIETALAFPGWNIDRGAEPYPTSTAYNTLSLGGPAVILMGPEFPNAPGYPPLQGSYSVLMQHFVGLPPALSQTARVPTDARSITFLVRPGQTDGQISLSGVPIPLVPLAGGRMGGDVSAFAGLDAELMFSTSTAHGTAGDWFYFDDVRFSSSSIPEPGAIAWIAALFGGFWCRKRKGTAK